jgi:hypothetical protein
MTDLDPRLMTEETFGVWRNHPVTRAFMRYLADYAEALEGDHLGRWRQGTVDAALDAEARGRVLTLYDMTELTYASINDFYHASGKDTDIDAGQDTV